MRANEEPPSNGDSSKRGLATAGILHRFMSQRGSIIEGLYRFSILRSPDYLRRLYLLEADREKVV